MHFRTVTECSCLKCKSMCQNSPCMGTPEDIQKIMDAGYGDKLMFSLWTDHKSANAPLPAIMPIKGPRGCVFQDKKGLCDLHAAGLKPTEGKLAIHDQNDNGLRRTVGYTWISEAGISVFQRFGVPNIDQLRDLIREMIPCIKQGRILNVVK